MSLKRKYSLIKYFQANLGRARNVIHYYEVENKPLEAQKAIYEIRAIRAHKGDAKAKGKLHEALDRYGDTNEEEEQLRRRRRRTIGLKNALAKERE